MASPQTPYDDSGIQRDVVDPSTGRKTIPYEVGSFETLNSVALKFGMSTSELVKLNKLHNKSVYPGQQLLVYEMPKRASVDTTRPRRASVDTSSRSVVKGSETSGGLVQPENVATTLSSETDTSKTSATISTAERVSIGRTRLSHARSLPLLTHLLQQRDRKYFFEGSSADLTRPRGKSMSSVTDPGPSSPKLRPFLARIPDEFRLQQRDIFKEHVRYFINEKCNVLGELTVTPSGIFFEPELDDPITKEVGLLRAQFQCDLQNITDVQVVETSEVIASWRKVAKTFDNEKELAAQFNANIPPSRDSTLIGVDSPSRSEGKPKFIRLVVSRPTQESSTVYFLVNRWSAETIFKKITHWLSYLLAQQATVDEYSTQRRPSTVTRGSETVTPEPSVTPTLKREDSDTQLNDIPVLDTKSTLINSPNIIKKLVSYLPPRYQLSQSWQLLYSTQKHGISLNTFYSRVRRKGPTLVFVEDEDGFVFGGFASQSWEPQKGYFGTGESFLFTIYPSFNIYPWSGLNEYFLFARDDQIAFGGGGGKFGLWLDSDFDQGTSCPCETFLNTCLAGQEHFRCTVLECWGFADVDERY